MTMCIKANFKFIISDIRIFPIVEYPLMYFLIFINYLSFMLCVFSDPGITEGKQYDKMKKLFKYDNIIFFDGNECGTCKIVKLPRSKHCSICGHCVMLHDHHCIWMNNCIGYNNFKWFLTFLVSLSGILLYGLLLNFRYLAGHRYLDLQQLLISMNLSNINFWKSYIRSVTIKGIFQNYLQIYYNFYKLICVSLFTIGDFTNISETSKATKDPSDFDLPSKLAISFILICFIFIVVMSMFISEIYSDMIVAGMTTNEKSKWVLIQDFVTNKELYKYYTNNFPAIAINEKHRHLIADSNAAKFVYIAKHYFYNDKILDNQDSIQAEEFHSEKSCLDVLKKKLFFKGIGIDRFDENYIIDYNKLHGTGKYKYFTLDAYKETEVAFSSKDMKLIGSMQEIENIYDLKSKWSNLKLILNGT